MVRSLEPKVRIVNIAISSINFLYSGHGVRLKRAARGGAGTGNRTGVHRTLRTAIHRRWRAVHRARRVPLACRQQTCDHDSVRDVWSPRRQAPHAATLPNSARSSTRPTAGPATTSADGRHRVATFTNSTSAFQTITVDKTLSFVKATFSAQHKVDVVFVDRTGAVSQEDCQAQANFPGPKPTGFGPGVVSVPDLVWTARPASGPRRDRSVCKPFRSKDMCSAAGRLITAP